MYIHILLVLYLKVEATEPTFDFFFFLLSLKRVFLKGFIQVSTRKLGRMIGDQIDF